LGKFGGSPAHTAADQHKLFVPRTSTSTFGSRAFSSSSPSSWNALPPQLRDPAISISIFRQSLKTHLFNTLIDSVSLLFCTFIGFLQLRHRTRFRDSFCLANVFKCLFTYLPEVAGKRRGRKAHIWTFE